MAAAHWEQENMLRCRLCLEDEVEELISLYCRCDTQDKLVVEMVNDLVRLDPPQETDKLPQHICDRCLIRLDTAYSFQQKSRNAEQAFKRMLFENVGAEHGGVCCRVCQRNDVDELISVFCVSGGEDKLVADMMKEACGLIRPAEDDGLPQNICGECFEILSTTYTFRDTILKSDFTIRKNMVKVEVVDNGTELNTEKLIKQEEDVPGSKKRHKLPPPLPQPKVVPQNDEDKDPFIYLDATEVEAERLMPLFLSTEDAEYYEQLIFFGIICCCGKLMEDDREWGEHRAAVHTTKDGAGSYRHKCNDCLRRFQYASDLIEHLENRDKKLFYRCKICNILTKDKRTLQSHFEFTRFHPFLDESETDRLSFDEKVETMYESLGNCCGCYEEFENGESLLSHTQLMHFPDREDHPMFQCMICYNSFSDKQSLLKHQLASIGTTTYECRAPECEFRSKQRSVMKKHIEAGLHLNVGMLPAPEPEPELTEFFCCFHVCNKTFESRDSLELHCINDHAEQRIRNSNFTENNTKNVCPLCIRHFPSNSAFKKHLRLQYDRKYICPTCGRKCVTRDYLSKHEKSHSQVKIVFQCDQCDSSFSNKHSLVVHKKKIHALVFTNLCNTCGKSFALKSSLKYHIANKHLETRPYKCTICSRDFGVKPLLDKHMTTHSTERPFKCSYCDNTYRHQSDIKRHEDSVHLNNRPFVCDVCEASFIRERDLRVHMTRHTNERFFKCTVANCDYSTNIAKRLEDHLNAKHDDTKMTLE
ncbi:zinc finger protein 33A-like [Ochlerotatus camptorhynchus]|uniref:zinc finger protein 33A-like n=1 Tax=Ochlerotatus camptorhynchus TaxID=644619 RepID=UPI0031E05C0B